MRELVGHLFIGFFVELVCIGVAWRVGDDRRKQVSILLVGTLLAGWIAFSPSMGEFLLRFVSTGTQPISSTPAIEAVSPVALVETQKTGVGQRRVYSVTLAPDEIVVGDAYDFRDQGHHCVAFIIQGPGTKQFAVLDGAWYRFSGVTNEDQADELLQARVDYLREYWFCKDVEFPVIRE